MLGFKGFGVFRVLRGLGGLVVLGFGGLGV